MKLFASILSAVVLFATPVFAGGHIVWNADREQSVVAFGSIKKNTVGEVHQFTNVSGTVKEQGAMTITIDLSSVQTNIDIRNERMIKHVFQEGKATATITGQIDMDEVNGLQVGDTMIVELEAELAFAGSKNDIEANMLIARLADNKVLVTTADFIMISTEDLGIDAGIDMLMKLAKLPGITRTVPVSVRAIFTK